MSVLAVLEQRGGKWNRTSFEALAAAERRAIPFAAALLEHRQYTHKTRASNFNFSTN